MGEGESGKTTLANKLQNPNYQLKNEDTTRGIEVIQWYFPLSNGQQFRVNIWDFGGQEIYHTTHQFFLSKRALYLLVADNRKEDTDFYYWLNVVQLLSENSPLLIISNEKGDRPKQIPESDLRKNFNNLKEILPTNLQTNRGLQEILKVVPLSMMKLPHIGSPLPKTWIKIRKALENDQRNYISLDEYQRICQTAGINQQDRQNFILEYLHDIGVCLHFKDNILLKKIVILKPKWGTDAVYKVLDNQQIVRNFGKFSQRELATIWGDEQYRNMQDELLQLMTKFKLCYEIPNQPNNYIAPQLLSANPPQYAWNDAENLHFRYQYEFMPKGIITRLIVEMNKFIEGQKNLWKTGVILKEGET
ncbi:MAG TPA: COR domain-containing protein, partial [Allocoleopsis sp.]